jgi:hypothetical protein
MKIPVNEFGESPVVIDCPAAGPAGHIQFEPRDAKSILHVHGNQTDAELVLCSRSYGMLCCPPPGICRALQIIDLPDFSGPERFKMGRQRKFITGHWDLLMSESRVQKTVTSCPRTDVCPAPDIFTRLSSSLWAVNKLIALQPKRC